jgi:hypothetical protein
MRGEIFGFVVVVVVVSGGSGDDVSVFITKYFLVNKLL